MARTFDLTLVGATGFTGRLVAERLAQNAPANLKLALAGRDEKKLLGVLETLPNKGRFTIRVCDTQKPEAVAELARETRVVCTTVGPYYRLGFPLMEACASAGTHLCDLTGEVTYMRACIDRFDAAAKAKGAKLVHTCGFDSIPSDLGLFALHRFLVEKGLDGRFTSATLATLKASGGFSGGTVASLVGVLETAGNDKAMRKTLIDAYSLSPDRAAEPDVGRQSDVEGMKFDAELGRWTAPFVMASVNTRVVRRSNALLGYAYGRQIRYKEVTAFNKGIGGWAMAAGLTGGLAALVGGLNLGLTRPLILGLLPKPGEGPDKAAREAGHFTIRHFVTTESGQRAQCTVVGTADPGYGETSKMLSESALSLCEDEAQLPKTTGVLTPATAFGTRLVDRLVAKGMTFEPRLVDSHH